MKMKDHWCGKNQRHQWGFFRKEKHIRRYTRGEKKWCRTTMEKMIALIFFSGVRHERKSWSPIAHFHLADFFFIYILARFFWLLFLFFFSFFVHFILARMTSERASERLFVRLFSLRPFRTKTALFCIICFALRMNLYYFFLSFTLLRRAFVFLVLLSIRRRSRASSRSVASFLRKRTLEWMRERAL